MKGNLRHERVKTTTANNSRWEKNSFWPISISVLVIRQNLWYLLQKFTWVNSSIAFSIPIAWREQLNHTTGCYFCLTSTKVFNGRNKNNLIYANAPSVTFWATFRWSTSTQLYRITTWKPLKPTSSCSIECESRYLWTRVPGKNLICSGMTVTI